MRTVKTVCQILYLIELQRTVGLLNLSRLLLNCDVIMVNYQFKIEYSEGKFVKTFRDIGKLTSFTFYNLVEDIKKHCPGYAHLSPQTIRIRFLDEDGDYINLTEDDSLNFEEMLQQAKFVEKRDLRRIQLRISELDSPCPVKQSPADKRRKLDTKLENAAVVLKPRSLDFSSSRPEKNQSCTDGDSTTSALEKYVSNARKNANIAKTKLEQLRHEQDEILQKLEAARIAGGDADSKICGNCHLRLGHTQKKCTLEKCLDVFSCGQEKRHPGQFNRRRLDQDISRQEKIVAEAEEEVKRRTLSIETVQKSKTKQIESKLMDSHKGDYTNENGNLNWNLIRKHTVLIEKYCKKYMNGKIPGKQSISDVLRKATEEYNKDCDQTIKRAKKRKGNPAKKILEDHGIQFPGTSEISSDSEAEDFHKVKQSPDLRRAMPKTTEEEESQLELALHASLHAKNVTGLASSTLHRSTNIDQATVPMPMYPYYPMPNFGHYGPAPFMQPNRQYYNYLGHGLIYDQQEQYQPTAGFYHSAPSTSTITSHMQTDSSNDAVSNETSTCIPATEISSVPDGDDTIASSCASDESAAMALLSLKKDSKKK